MNLLRLRELAGLTEQMDSSSNDKQLNMVNELEDVLDDIKHEMAKLDKFRKRTDLDNLKSCLDSLEHLAGVALKVMNYHYSPKDEHPEEDEGCSMK